MAKQHTLILLTALLAVSVVLADQYKQHKQQILPQNQQKQQTLPQTKQQKQQILPQVQQEQQQHKQQTLPQKQQTLPQVQQEQQQILPQQDQQKQQTLPQKQQKQQTIPQAQAQIPEMMQDQQIQEDVVEDYCLLNRKVICKNDSDCSIAGCEEIGTCALDVFKVDAKCEVVGEHVCGSCTDLLVCDVSGKFKSLGCPQGTFCVNGACSQTNEDACKLQEVKGKCVYKQQLVTCVTHDDCVPIDNECGMGRCMGLKVSKENEKCKMIGEHTCSSCTDLLVCDAGGLYKKIGCPTGTYCLNGSCSVTTQEHCSMYEKHCIWNV